MHKALTQMNVQLANVISDVVGESGWPRATGQKILRAIVAGERDGYVLGTMKNARLRASIDEIAKRLQGNWRAEHLFALKQALGAFDFVGTQLAECDREIELQLQRLQAHDGEPAKGKQLGRASQCAQVRFAHAALQDVRCGFNAHRWNICHHGLGSPQRDGFGPVMLCHSRALHELAGFVPWHQDHRGQGDER